MVESTKERELERLSFLKDYKDFFYKKANSRHIDLSHLDGLTFTELVKHKKDHMTVFDLELHERFWLNGLDIDVVRVPGGWIYSNWDFERNVIVSGVFVPFKKE